MAISRLRLELAAWFACAVLVTVGAVDVGFTVYLRRQATQRFVNDLRAAAAGVLQAVRQEQRAGSAPLSATTDALSEWPASIDAFVVYAPDSTVLGSRGGAALLALASRPAPAGQTVWDEVTPAGIQARLTVAGDTGSPHLRVVAIRPTAELTRYAELLMDWLLLSVPGVTVVALVAGYFLARRALRPLDAVTAQVAAMDPANLADRLPTRTPPDEIDRLAEHFNVLLARLADLRTRNREFLSRVAHQLKTPLTLVRGESELGLERERDPGAYRAILDRIGRAADQMATRVDDLFLLARAEAGDEPPRTDQVELDALALECTDLMRGRAQRAQRALSLERVDGDVATGNQPLLREALLELIENAIRHGSDHRDIRVSAYAEAGRAHLSVASAGPPLVPGVGGQDAARAPGRGLGLSIVRWIAQVHRGDLHVVRDGDANTFDLAWPQQAAV